mmetsp:Transcript_7036/g.10746  ORF Transcript_7036/g.10746 Transcript_7036/m.10746 type:complete len:149 (+) Transcript_7036:136-582(+)
MATGTSHVDQVVVVPADIKRGACSTIIFSLSDGSKVPAIVQYLQDYEEGSVINVRYIGDNKAFVTHVVYDKKTYEKVRAQYVKHMAESKPEKAGKCPNGSDNIGVSTSREDRGSEGILSRLCQRFDSILRSFMRLNRKNLHTEGCRNR